MVLFLYKNQQERMAMASAVRKNRMDSFSFFNEATTYVSIVFQNHEGFVELESRGI